jgi:hypothetical protein
MSNEGVWDLWKSTRHLHVTHFGFLTSHLQFDVNPCTIKDSDYLLCSNPDLQLKMTVPSPHYSHIVFTARNA